MQKIKYPRTMNLPFSKSESSDDVWWKNCSAFENKEVVVSEKLDGECTSIYTDGTVHARSLDTSPHPSRNWIKKFASTFCYKIPTNWRVCGENLFAWHSILYKELPTYFFVYGIYDENNMCLSWDDTEMMCKELGLHTVPILYRGIWDEKKIKKIWTGKGSFPTFATNIEYPTMDDFFPCEAEGYVIRLTESFNHSEFAKCCGKFVRKNHVTTSVQWMQRKVIPNQLTELNSPIMI